MGIVVRTFVLANICSVGEKAKIIRFISKNKIFFFLYKRVYHFPTTLHHNLPLPQLNLSQNHQPQQNHTLYHTSLPTNYTTLPNHKTNQPTPLPLPTTTKKTYKIKHYTQPKPKTSKINYKTIPSPPSTTQHKKIHPTTPLQNKNINPPLKLKN